MWKRITAASVTGIAIIVVGASTASAGSATVEQGDTLSGLAAQHDTTWTAIFDANQDVIDDPDLIYPGQVLTIPDSGEIQETREAAETASTSRSAERTRPATGQVTSPYGMRTHPITGEHKLHTGTDYGYGDGVARAAADGTVAAVEWSTAYGNLVTIAHSDGVSTRYAHLASVAVADGQNVNSGDHVGSIGSTGYSTGAHLHFEVLRDGDVTDPVAWLTG